MALTLSKRMDIVEQKLAGLDSLPERMTALESQFLQLRTEVRAEFSALRSELHVEDSAIQKSLREEIRVSADEVTRTLREEIRAGDEETRRVLREEIAALGTHMRVLHVDLVEKIKLTQEGRPGRPRARR